MTPLSVTDVLGLPVLLLLLENKLELEVLRALLPPTESVRLACLRR